MKRVTRWTALCGHGGARSHGGTGQMIASSGHRDVFGLDVAEATPDRFKRSEN